MPISMKSFLVKSRNNKSAPSQEGAFFKARQAAEQEVYGKFLEEHKEAWDGDMKKG